MCKNLVKILYEKRFNHLQQTVTYFSTVLIFTILTNGNAVTTGKTFYNVTLYDTTNTTTTETNVPMDNIFSTTTNVTSVTKVPTVLSVPKVTNK